MNFKIIPFHGKLFLQKILLVKEMTEQARQSILIFADDLIVKKDE
jgi:hypothetical protein